MGGDWIEVIFPFKGRRRMEKGLTVRLMHDSISIYCKMIANS
jgi:hypothetical protein